MTRVPRAPVVRIQGIDAYMTKQSYVPGEVATLRAATDAPEVAPSAVPVGAEREVVYADNQMAGVEVGFTPKTYTFNKWWRSRTRRLTFKVPEVPSGLYYAQLAAPDGRVGYAVFVVRPTQLGATRRVLVVLPTDTWQAYNFQDVNGDGYGDTWYAGPPNQTVDTVKPYIARGAPPRFYRYDLPFLHWLYWSGKAAEFISDADFGLIASGDDLSRAYDLSSSGARGVRHDPRIRPRAALPRPRGEPDVPLGEQLLLARRQERHQDPSGEHVEAAGPAGGGVDRVQYRANDSGQRQGLYVLEDTARAPWAWVGTSGSPPRRSASSWAATGIEIDGTSKDSPPGTR